MVPRLRAARRPERHPLLDQPGKLARQPGRLRAERKRLRAPRVGERLLLGANPFQRQRACPSHPRRGELERAGDIGLRERGLRGRHGQRPQGRAGAVDVGRDERADARQQMAVAAGGRGGKGGTPRARPGIRPPRRRVREVARPWFAYNLRVRKRGGCGGACRQRGRDLPPRLRQLADGAGGCLPPR